MILGSRLFDELDQERIVCITGSLSGGKTRLAFDLLFFIGGVGIGFCPMFRIILKLDWCRNL